jgi:hypothetical protein
LLLAGWLRSRLRRKITLTRRSARALESISVDGLEIVPPRSSPERASDLLSDELDVFGRDPVYEAAVRAAV